MAGIYIHIPFCKQACHYCDFHFSTSLKSKESVLSAINLEIVQRAIELAEETVESIYFGGGTPSILAIFELKMIVETIQDNFKLSKNIEITMECNPDDLDQKKLEELKKIGVNRLSVGIQSFEEAHLKFMNRAHSSREATESIRLAKLVGFDNISIDLIYGIPDMNQTTWESNIQKAIDLGVDHISSYCLTVEEGTALAHFVKIGKVIPATNETEAVQFDTLVSKLSLAGFEQYEVSNFAKKGFISRHNSSYWKGKKYVGVGPGAHSFDGKIRRWNISNNIKYAKALESHEFNYESELLTEKDRINEHLMTGLRTKWGVDMDFLKNDMGYELTEENSAALNRLVANNEAIMLENKFYLTSKGLLKADKIASDLFVI